MAIASLAAACATAPTVVDKPAARCGPVDEDEPASREGIVPHSSDENNDENSRGKLHPDYRLVTTDETRSRQ
jgi:hypothetical protein